MQRSQFSSMFEMLTQPSYRLPAVQEWLRNEVWSDTNFKSLSPQQYLEQGERLVLKTEELLLGTALNLYDELVAESLKMPRLVDAFRHEQPTAIVVFDGCSIREIPLLIDLARRTGFELIESGYSYAALPSETISFVNQRIIGKELSPSRLENRKELTQQGITAYYYDTSIRSFEIRSNGSLLLWSSFPDGTYMNFEARSSEHFESIVKQFDVAWQRTVLAIPRGYRIIITSDHGYVYLGTRMESERRADEALKILNNDRFRVFDTNETLPCDVPELQVIPSLRLAMLRGRIKNRPQGPSGNKAFRHGGMSLMEMITPWIVLERQ